ncbi:MAG: DUF2892 domain-containing protein [Verrucomicrobia bacterium]|nr:DUF2892 domain-containing protein [Verrucomicrobiota bacterium]
MKSNVGKTDKIIRVLVGVAIIGAGLYFKNWWGAVGAIPLITGLIGWCPLYCPLKISTKK